MNKILNEKAISLIDGQNFGNLATVMKDGSPQVTPVWINREGDNILVNTAVGRTKQRNILKDQRVAVSIYDQKNPYSMVLIKGHVISQSSDGADEHIDLLAKKYIGKDKYPWRQANEKRVIIKIQPDTLFSM